MTGENAVVRDEGARSYPDLISAWLFRNMPLVAYGTVYILTCLIGAVLILERVEPFYSLYIYYSGTQAPTYDNSVQVTATWALLIVAPLLLGLGYSCAGWLVRRFGAAADSSGTAADDDSRGLIVLFLFSCASIAWGVWDLASVLSLPDLRAWINYDMWVKMRWRLFDALSFASWVNLYLILPLCAAGMLVMSLEGRRLKWVAWNAVLATLFIELCLFQKKALLVSMILIGVAVWIHLVRVRPSVGGLRSLGVAVIALLTVYFGLVVAPVYEQAAKTEQKHKTEQKQLVLNAGKALAKAGITPGVLLYATMAPLTRTSAPALYYPWVFPDRHPYYGLDFGQDILGVGAMPDDNRVVWRAMNPGMDGATGAPFQFVLYSQVGIVGALFVSFLVGGFLGATWILVDRFLIEWTWNAMARSLVVLFGIYLAIDSVRNSLLVSYGVLWACLILILMYLTAVKILPHMVRVIRCSRP